MVFDPPLEEVRFVRRYQRFFAEFQTPDGDLVTAHCPNTGSMRNCFSEDCPAWISRSANPKRKLAYTWELSTSPHGAMVGVNTSRANQLVREALLAGVVEELGALESLRSEVKYGKENSRIDFVVNALSGTTYIEVKSVTLCETEGAGYFPDSVSDRATRHLRELQAICEAGGQAMLVFCVQHSGIQTVAPARHIDVAYGKAFDSARRAGLKIIALGANMTSDGIWLDKRLDACSQAAI